MAFNYQINITAVNRAEEVFARLERLFASLAVAMERFDEMSQKSRQAGQGAAEVMQQLGAQADESAKKAANLSDVIATGMIKAQAAIALVSNAVNFLKGKFMEAADIQLQNISAASTFSSLAKISYEEAAKFTDSFNAKISEAAASLPGSTAQYAQLARVIGDSVVPAFRDASGQVDIKAYEEGLFQLVRTYGAVAAGGGIDIGNTALGLTKAFMGSSTAELRQIQIFEQNPVILNAIEDALKAKGASKLGDVSEADRLKILTDAAKLMITDDFIKRSSESVSGLMEGFNSAIFDPSTGLLGVFRDLDEEAEGSQTAFQSFNDLLVRILGGEGIFGQLQKFLEAMNLPDPMRIVKQSLDFAIAVLDQVIRVMKDINILIESGYNIFQVINYLFNGYFRDFADFPKFITSTIDSVLDAVEGLISRFDGEALGRLLADGIDGFLAWLGRLMTGGVTALKTDENQFLGRLGMIISDLVFQLFVALGAFFRNLDASTWVTIASAALAAFVIPAAVSSIAALLPAVVGAAGITLIGGVPGLLLLAAVAAFTALGKAIWDRRDQIAQHIEPFFTPITRLLSLVQKLFDGVFAVITGDMDGIKIAASEILSAFKTLIQAIVGQFSAAYDALVSTINLFLSAVGGENIKTSGELRAEATRQLAERRYAEAAANRLPAATSRWTGHIPSAVAAFDGLFAAIAAEAANMPPGAQLAIANTSEAILTPPMLRNLVSNAVSAGASLPPSPIPPIQIIVNGAQDAKSVAHQVVQELEAMLDDYMQGQLV